MDFLFNVLQVGIGVGLVIFVHELGHFLAAKAVGIRVERFSLGFPPRLLGFRWGDTDYCLSAIPLGGYVKMAGEGPEDHDPAPDSFSAKSVGARSLVISAGVIMNVIFALVGFLVAFKLGVQMNVPVVGSVVPGTVADGHLLRGDEILAIDGERPLDFVDVALSAAFADDNGVSLTVRRNGEERALRLVPRRELGQQVQRLGIQPIEEVGAIHEGSAAERAGLREGDRLISVEPRERLAIDLAAAPAGDATLTAALAQAATRLAENLRAVEAVAHAEVVAGGAPHGGPRVLVALREGVGAEEPIPLVRALAQAVQAGVTADLPPPTVEAVRDAETLSLGAVLAALEQSPGAPRKVRVWREGRVAVVDVTPAALAVRDVGIELASLPITTGLVKGAPAAEGGLEVGDVIRTINGRAASVQTIVTDVKAIAASDAPVIRLEVEREGKPLRLELHPERRSNGPVIGAQFGVGVVQAVQPGSPAADAGIAPGSILLEVGGESADLSPGELRQLATRLGAGQSLEVAWRTPDGQRKSTKLVPTETEERYGELGAEFRLAMFTPETSGFVEPIRLGIAYTWLNMVRVFLTLQGMFTQRIDSSTLGGPITIVSQAYEMTQRGLGTLLYFLCIISVNLAILNILPVPVLDGGHLVFLAVEGLKGSPVSMVWQERAQQVGLLMILALVIFVTKNDIARLISS